MEKIDSDGRVIESAYEFSITDFYDSHTSATYLIKNQICRTLLVWNELSQRRIMASLNISSTNLSLQSSVSSNLNSGTRRGFYVKTGKGELAKYKINSEKSSYEISQEYKIKFDENIKNIVKNYARSKA